MKWAGGRFKNPQEKLFTRNPRSWAVGHLGTQHCRYCKLICIQEKTGRGQKRDTWKQQPKTYSDCPQAADLPGWSIYTQGCITTHLPCSLLGHVFWPINKLNYHTHADPGWWGLDFSNLTNVVLDEADLEKDKTNCSLLLLGLIDALTLATLASWSFKAACSVQPRHQKKVRPFHLHGWFSSKRERAQGTEIKLAPGQPSNFCRVWSLLKVANVWSSQGCRCFAGQMLGEMNLQTQHSYLCPLPTNTAFTNKNQHLLLVAMRDIYCLLLWLYTNSWTCQTLSETHLNLQLHHTQKPPPYTTTTTHGHHLRSLGIYAV